MGQDAGVGSPGGLQSFVPGPDGRRGPALPRSLDRLAGRLHPFDWPTGDGGRRVELEVVVGGDAWLERLLLRLGPDARVVEPPELRSLGAEAAARVLLRYPEFESGAAS